MLRTQEIFILIVLANREGAEWTYEQFADELRMPVSQVFKSLERARIADLFVKDERRVIRRNLLEFLIHGVRYAFPVEVGRVVRGVPCGWETDGLRELMESSEVHVWPSPLGSMRGRAIEPFHKSLPIIASLDAELHAQFALVDIIRVGSARERKVAAEELEVRIG